MKSTTREEENNELQKEFYALAIYSCALVLGSDGFLSRHLLLQVRREPRGLLTERTPQRFFFSFSSFTLLLVSLFPATLATPYGLFLVDQQMVQYPENRQWEYTE